MSNTVAVAISGGLGNQMFQYAAARALAARCDAELMLDLSFYNAARHRNFELNAFPIETGRIMNNQSGAGSAISRWSRKILGRSFERTSGQVYREPHFHYDPAFEILKAPIRLEGYFSSPRYFEGYEAIIRRELTPPPAADAESQTLAPLISAPDTIALHVRRGDFVSRPKINALMGTCSNGYYEAALARMPGDGTVFVFSDDIPWARANLSASRPMVLVGEDAPRTGLADFWLMTLARHHIIANSSFSWWAAWLARQQGGEKIAPARWFANSSNDDKDLIPATWTRLPA